MKDKLIGAVIRNKDKIPYINLNEKNQYRGWTANFNILRPCGEAMRLDLRQERDLFLLFVLASAWSKTGPWENAAYFTTYLKDSQLDEVQMWLDEAFARRESNARVANARQIAAACQGFVPRHKISFRKDYYSSVVVLAQNWAAIKRSLAQSSAKDDFSIFIDLISSLEGLGAGQNRMRIKIPLILRELRCQEIYPNIPGKLCCVPDKRVEVAAKELDLKLPCIGTLSGLFKASAVIYQQFGDLYDIPLFAYEDVKADLR